MRTSDLIRGLAADNEARATPPARALAIALVPAIAIAMSLHLAIIGLRPDLVAALGTVRPLFKLSLMVLLAILSAPLALHLVRPGADARKPALALAIVPGFLIAAVLAELLAISPTLWGQRLIGSNAVVCLKSIPFLGSVPLAVTLLALRQGAPEHPGLAGAAAGLFAGAIGAACYATHCPDDSPLFVATWYTLAIGFVALAGAAAGRRLLRW